MQSRLSYRENHSRRGELWRVVNRAGGTQRRPREDARSHTVDISDGDVRKVGHTEITTELTDCDDHNRSFTLRGRLTVQKVDFLRSR